MANLQQLINLPLSRAQMKQILATKIDQAGVPFQVATRLAGKLIDSGFGPYPQVYEIDRDKQKLFLEYSETLIKIEGDTYKKITRQ